jgi:cellulose synthase/poly-beta-1,6-N-acetylglucosamine synthase-like glycosyltransferase
LDYPPDKIQVIAISDGSDDSTVTRIRDAMRHNHWRDIQLIEFTENRGQAAAQNAVALSAAYDLLVSTDADTEFPRDVLTRLARAFQDPSVAVVGGRMDYRPAASSISQSIGQYREMEWELRRLEDALNVLTKTDGPCTAYRREVWEEIEDFEDVDQVVVYFARRRGLTARHLDEVVCIDTPNSEWRQELRARARMTRKGLLSMFNRWSLHDWIREPGFTFALFSHKVVRYLSPAALLAFSVGVVWLMVEIHRSADLPLIPFGIAALLILITATYLVTPGWARRRAGQATSFLLANLGFAWGVVGWLAGDRRGRYVPSRKRA